MTHDPDLETKGYGWYVETYGHQKNNRREKQHRPTNRIKMY